VNAVKLLNFHVLELFVRCMTMNINCEYGDFNLTMPVEEAKDTLSHVQRE